MSNEQWSEWIEWNGGECPLNDEAFCQVKTRNGKQDMDARRARGWRWTHISDMASSDIIAYRYRLDDNTMTEEEQEIPAEDWNHKNEAGLQEGNKYDAGKAAMDLIPPYMEEEVAMVLAFGAQKYAPNNWRKVTPFRSRYLAAAQRHINALKKGQQMDPESGLHHAAHAVCCLMFLGEVELEVPSSRAKEIDQ